MKILRGLFAAVLTVAALPMVSQSVIADVQLNPDSPFAASVTTPKSSSQPPQPPWERKFERFVDLKEMDFALRYRSVFDSNNAHEFDQGQQRTIVDGRIKFDKQARYSLGFHASSGHYFNWAYADFMNGGNQKALETLLKKLTPVQLPALYYLYLTNTQDVNDSIVSGGWSVYVRRLYLNAEPVKGFEMQYGALDINRGAASEITTYDLDGYIDGERVSFKRPDKVFLDEVSVTYAFLGNIYKPNFVDRTRSLAHSNYHQFLLRKQVGKRVNASLDLTLQDKTNTWREAVFATLPEARAFDTLRFEFYQRHNPHRYPSPALDLVGGNGWALTLQKKVHPRLNLDYGFADIDTDYVILTPVPIAVGLSLAMNGDNYGVGKRYFVRPTIKLNSYLDLAGFYTHSFNTTPDAAQVLWNKEALTAGLVLDLKKALFRSPAVK